MDAVKLEDPYIGQVRIVRQEIAILSGSDSVSLEISVRRKCHAQLVGLVNKVAQLIEAFKLGTESVELHRDVPGAATECPGKYFPKDVFMKKLEESFS